MRALRRTTTEPGSRASTIAQLGKLGPTVALLALTLGLAACPADGTRTGTSDTQDAVDTTDTRETGDPDTNVSNDTDADTTDTDADTTDTLDTSADTDTADTDAVATDTDTVPTDTTSPAAVMRVHLLDVGQGEAILVEFPCGAMLVDTGGEVTEVSASSPAFDSVSALESQLRAFFAGRPDLNNTLDLVVLTHPHIDHTRGVPRLIELVQRGDLTIKNVVTNGAEGSGSGVGEQRELHDFADSEGDVGRWYVLQRKTTPLGQVNAVIDPFPACAKGDGPAIDPRITALWGRIDETSPLWSSWLPDDLADQNNHSVVLRIDFGESSILMTGDLEEPGIAELITQFGGTGLLDVDLYKAGHHGSFNGTTPALINAMSPEVALISAGPARRVGDWTAWAYGHPRWQAVSDMLGDSDSMGVSAERERSIDALVATSYSNGHGVFVNKRITPAVYCTGWDGAVTVDLSSDGRIVTEPLP